MNEDDVDHLIKILLVNKIEEDQQSMDKLQEKFKEDQLENQKSRLKKEKRFD